jgi:hypothetical protein
MQLVRSCPRRCAARGDPCDTCLAELELTEDYEFAEALIAEADEDDTPEDPGLGEEIIIVHGDLL